ncbi:MAG: glycosyltransferase [Solirubrobacterales bacterium]|nr:glycosyltransferase [Solirubrobacterales bacterium]
MPPTGAPDRDLDPADDIACSVLVPVLNEERHIRSSVSAMLAQNFRGRLEVLLVDGGSTDGTRAILEDLARADPRVRVLDNPRGRTPSGLNVALRHARGRWVARMDAHTAYPPDYIARGVERLERGGTRWVSGPVVPVGRSRVSRAVALALRSALGRGGSRKWHATNRPGEEYELDSGVFAGVWARETVLEYGGWDEEWARNQDAEMAGRFLGRGERLICLPQMGAEYTPRDALRPLWRQYGGYGEYRVKTALRHPHTMRRSHLLPPLLVMTAGVALAAPAPLRRAARTALAVYAGTLFGAGARAAAHAEHRADAVMVPVVLAVIHFGNGVGVIRGVLRNGFPLAAVATALGAVRAAAKLGRDPEPVSSPSLGG